MKRHEEVEDEKPTVFLLIFNDAPVYFIHGAYSSERKLYAELDRLAKLPENKRRANKNPMDLFSIREITVT